MFEDDNFQLEDDDDIFGDDDFPAEGQGRPNNFYMEDKRFDD